MTGYLFPGQGAQFAGMGKDVYDTFPDAKDLFDRASRIVGWDVADTCFNGPAERLSETSICQPCILVTSLAVAAALRAKGAAGAACAAGLSLGEYTGLAYAGGMPFDQVVDVVRQRGAAMQECCETRPGGMTSVIGLEVAQVEEICEAVAGAVQVANLNSPIQTVISGEPAALDEAEARALAGGAKRVVRLDVAGAFHSPLMAPAAETLAKALKDAEISPPSLPVYSNVTARPLPDSAEGIRELLVAQVTSRVKWHDTIREMIGAGAKSFAEVGPGKTLKGLLRSIDRSVNCVTVGTVDEITSLDGFGGEKES